MGELFSAVDILAPYDSSNLRICSITCRTDHSPLSNSRSRSSSVRHVRSRCLPDEEGRPARQITLSVPALEIKSMYTKLEAQ